VSGFVTGGIVPALVVAIPSIALARRRPCPPSGLQKPAGRAYRWRGLVRPQLKMAGWSAPTLRYPCACVHRSVPVPARVHEWLVRRVLDMERPVRRTADHV